MFDEDHAKFVEFQNHLPKPQEKLPLDERAETPPHAAQEQREAA